MTELEKVTKIVEKYNIPLYIEHNDFISGGLTFFQELEDLEMNGEILEDDSIDACEKQSIWSARYVINGMITVVYAGSFDRVIELINKELKDRRYEI